jgi:hypothetical protein
MLAKLDVLTYHLVSEKSNTTDATSAAGTANLSGSPKFNSGL